MNDYIEKLEKLGFLDGLTNKRNTALGMEIYLSSTNGHMLESIFDLAAIRRTFCDFSDDIDEKIIQQIVFEMTKELEIREMVIEIRNKIKHNDFAEEEYCAEIGNKYKKRLNLILTKTE